MHIARLGCMAAFVILSSCGSNLGAVDLFSGIDGGGSSDGATQADSGGQGADGSNSAGDGGDDGGATLPDGGSPPDPGQITCGASSCALSTRFCCAKPGGADTCETSGGACTGGGGSERKCDEAADCTAGEVCCYDRSTTPPSTSCHPDCTGGGGMRTQACKTTSECLSGQCAVRSCSDGRTVESCQSVPGLCP